MKNCDLFVPGPEFAMDSSPVAMQHDVSLRSLASLTRGLGAGLTRAIVVADEALIWEWPTTIVDRLPTSA